ncbi:MAG: hypothetical protein J5612_02960 [Paludibacteraceae bacterium]|nr:hypothetical protein [Paludibacteraceae bacterium]
MKKFLIWFFVILLAVSAAAGWYAWDHGVRDVDGLVAFYQAEWQRLVGPAPEVPEAPEVKPAAPAKPKPAPKVDVVTTSAPEGHTVAPPEETTNKFSVFSEAEDEEYNPLLIGHWQCCDQAGWHRVYTDEYSGNGYYWGKEWNEDEDISEADLVDYGNGWFEWKMDGNNVLELAATDMNETRVPFIYTIKKLSDTELLYIEQRSKEKRVFKRQ